MILSLDTWLKFSKFGTFFGILYKIDMTRILWGLTRKVVFKFPNRTIIECESGSLAPKGRFISYIRA